MLVNLFLAHTIWMHRAMLMLKFFVDQNVPNKVSSFLVNCDYDVRLVRDIDSGMSDSKVLEIAQKENRIVVTNDKDFLRLSLNYSDVDIIVFAFKNQSSKCRIESLKKILPRLKNSFGVIVLNQLTVD
jgi:predicted nuclease of predicted toxin-antitoxin system